MVTESGFVKHTLKNGDTLESVAKELLVSIEYLMLMHNEQAIIFDKIKSRYEGLPEHLTEIFVTTEVLKIVEEKAQKKTGYAIFPDRFFERRTYGQVLENFENNDLQSKIHYEVEVVNIRNNQNQNIVEVNRKQVYINNKEPESIIDQLADKIFKTIFPVQLIIAGNGKIEAIANHDELKNRWISKQENLKSYFIEDTANKIIAKANIYFDNPLFLLEAIACNWFFNLFFKPIYGSYTVSQEIKYNTQFPLNGNALTEFEITQNIEKAYTKKNKLIINALGNVTENTGTAQETMYKTNIQYKLNGQDNTVNTINGLFTVTNNQKTNKIVVEIVQL